MDQKDFLALLQDVREKRTQVQKEAADLRRFLDECPPFVVREIKVSNFGRGLGPMGEVVMPGLRAPDFSEGGGAVSKALKLVSDTYKRRGKGKTFGRGEIREPPR